LNFVETEVKNNLRSSISKAKTVSAHHIIWPVLYCEAGHCKANRAHKAINLFACNFAKRSPILKYFALPNLAINTWLSES